MIKKYFHFQFVLIINNCFANKAYISHKKEVVSKRWHNLFFTFYSPAIFSFAYDAFF